MVPTELVVAAGIIASKDLLVKLLGPSADYVGGEIKNFVEKCNVNLDNIFKIAWRQLGPKVSEPGSVDIKVLKHILNEGRFIENKLTAEYFGGILAASRSVHPDDIGAYWLHRVEELSAFQIRLHYLIYLTAWAKGDAQWTYMGHDINYFAEGDEFTHDEASGVFIPLELLTQVMGVAPETTSWPLSLHNPLQHAIQGLVEAGLIRKQFNTGYLIDLEKRIIDERDEEDPGYDTYAFWEQRILWSRDLPRKEFGLLFTTSPRGIELFDWANGIKTESEKLGDPYFSLDFDPRLLVESSWHLLLCGGEEDWQKALQDFETSHPDHLIFKRDEDEDDAVNGEEQ